MKQQMKRLRGTAVSTSIGELILKDNSRLQFSEYDQMYFYSSQQSFLCKIYNLENQNSVQRYQRQKQIYSSGLYPNLAQCVSKSSFNVRKVDYGMIVLEKISRNTSLNEIANSLSFFQLLQMAKAVLQLIQQLKNRNQVFLNLRPQNIYIDAQKNYIIINPEYVSQKGTNSSVQETNQFFFNGIQKYFKYSSPEVLDNYTYFSIDSKSDSFSLGCILYQIIYGKYPFQSKFANINIIYQLQQGFFGKFIQRIFRPYKQRSEVQELLRIIEEELKRNPSQPRQANSSSTNQGKSQRNTHSIFDDISSVFNKYTKQSQGAYLNFTEDNESFPQAKHFDFILSKLLKNPNKVEKLQSIMSKHIKTTPRGSRKNFLIKNLILVFLVLRKNRNCSLSKWKDNIAQIKETLVQNDQCHEFSAIILKKIQLQQQLDSVLRGNFFLEDLCQFKLLSIPILQNMVRYLQAILAFSGKLLLFKEDDYLFQYVLEITCDEIFDLISMIILSVICIRKDNQLNLRKDNLAQLSPIQKSLNIILKKINSLSNKITSHAIYSVQADYYNYKEDIYPNDNPQHTSFQYFIKYCKHYKGLAIPENTAYYANQNGQHGSYQHTQKPNVKEADKKVFYANGISSDEEQPASSISNVYLQKKSEQVHVQKMNNSGPSNTQSKKVDINNLFGNTFFQQGQLRNTKSSQQSMSSSNITISQHKQVAQKSGFDDFNNFFGDLSKKPSPKQASTKVQNKSSDPFQNFSFFHNQGMKKTVLVSQQSKGKKQEISNLLNFDQPMAQKSAIKVDPNVLHQDIFNYQWLKKSQKSVVGLHQMGQNKQNMVLKPPPVQRLSPIILEIISALRLKQLKDLIVANRQVVIDFEKLTFQKVIGSGSAGQVYLGKYANQPVAIKKVKTKQNPNALKEFQRQLVTYIKIKKNPYLVSLIGLSKSGEDFFLLTEFCSGGSLFDLLHKRAAQINLSWKSKMSLILQVAKGMKVLHDMKPPIIHRDMKSLNVFIMPQNNEWIAKVADFGLSRSPQSQMMTMALGTLHWMAPQLLDNKQYSLKVDVYSFAIVMWEICARRTPYYQLSNPMAIMKYVTIDKKRPNMTTIDGNCPPKLLQLIRICWDEDPNRRPFFKQIIEILTLIDQQVPTQ